jgi:hypothetical protein
MLRKLALALAFTSLVALPTPGFAGHGGGGHGGGFHGGGFHGGGGGFHGGGYHGGGVYRGGGYRGGGYGVYRGGYRGGGYGVYRGGGGGRYWRGRYWAYGVGPCWTWNPFFGGWAWGCY